jgi:hypothetical protein
MTDSAFSGYHQLAAELQAQGYKISEDSLQRYGAKRQRKLEAMDLADHRAKMLVDTAPDGGETMIKAMLRLLRVELFTLMDETEQLEQGDIMRLGRMVTQLARITMAFQQWTDKLKLSEQEPKTSGRRLAKGEGGLSTPVYNAMFNMLVGKYIDEPAPDSELSVEEHRKIREGLAETGVLIPLALDDPRRSPGPPYKPYAPESPVDSALKSPNPGVSSPSGAAPQPPISSLPPSSIAPAHTERPSPHVAAHRPVPPAPPPVWCPRIPLPPRGY